MKIVKLIALFALLLSGVPSHGQKIDTFYGLKLGEKYGEKAVLNAILASGVNYKETPIVKDTVPSFGRITYSVAGVMLKIDDSQDAVKTDVTLIMSPENVFEVLSLAREGVDEKPLAFVADNALPEIMHYINANVTSVENTFFGIKLGSDVSLVSITRAVGASGLYHSSHNEGKTRVHAFKNVTYSDNEWDYALFNVTPSGKLVGFTVYDVYAGVFKGYHKADILYRRLRFGYLQKYGFSLQSAGEEDVLSEYVFSGQNGIDHIVSFFDTKAENGKDAFCVQMEFVHDALNRSL